MPSTGHTCMYTQMDGKPENNGSSPIYRMGRRIKVNTTECQHSRTSRLFKVKLLRAHKEHAIDCTRWRKLINDVRWSEWVWVGECFFWYWPTQVVPDKGPLKNGCVSAQSTECYLVCVLVWLTAVLAHGREKLQVTEQNVSETAATLHRLRQCQSRSANHRLAIDDRSVSTITIHQWRDVVVLTTSALLFLLRDSYTRTEIGSWYSQK